MVTYEQWNKAIISYIFEDREPGEKVFLHTTSDTLPEIAEQAGFDVADAVEGLIETVRNSVVRKIVVPTDEIWLRSISPAEKDPPHVAFLALCVLAASRMETSDDIFQTNYYVQLNKLLFGKLNKGKPKGLKYEDWEEFWIYLKDWVEDKYDVKLYLTQGHPKYVWYPISQCLISKHDEHKLHAIFKEAKLKPGAYLAEKQLLRILRSSRYYQNLSVKIKRPIREQKTAEIRLILDQIQLLLENWDGEVQEKIQHGLAKKRRSSSIDVQLKFNPFRSEDIDQIRYWFRCGRSTQINLKPNALKVESLQSDDSKWFEPFVVDADISSLQVLQKRIEIISDETRPLTYQLKPSDIWVFRNESEPDDGWFSQGNLLLHEDHRIVFRKEQNLGIISNLKFVCDPFTPPKSICVGGEETSWQYVDVKPIVLCNSPILGYSITTSKQISFVGGLPLDRRKNLYFDFCLPTIVVPDHYTLSDEPIYFNGKAMNVPSNRKIALTEKLDTGEYQLSYLNSRSTLRVISPTGLCEYEKQTFAINIDINSKNPPSFKDYKISEIPDESKVWLSGTKFFGEDNIPLLIERNEDTSVLSAAELISSVVKVAIELKQENTSPPKWFHKTINNINQDIALQALVKKKLNDYREKALSYHELCSLGGD